MSSTYKDFIKDSLNHYSMAIMMCGNILYLFPIIQQNRCQLY